MRIRSLPAFAAVLFAAGVLSACGGGAGPTTPASSPAASSPVATSPTIGPTASGTAPPATDWLQYHGNGARSGNAAGLPAAGRLAIAWSARLGGAVYGQPLVIGTTVVAATETDEVFGLDRATGAVRWRVQVGSPLPLRQQPCGLLDPLGITSTGVYDPQTQLAYFLAQSGKREHLLVGINPVTGAVRFRRSVPSPDRQPAYDQQRAALALTNGNVYVAFGGHNGDCGPYIGSVLGVPASGTGAILAYRVPTALQAGIWAAGGPVVGPDGTIYVSVGNGERSGSFDNSDSVTALTPGLTVAGIFAPTNWRMLSAGDLDLGSESPALLSDGRILQVGKTGVGYLLDASHLGGVGGQLTQGRVCPASSEGAFGGPAVAGSVVYVPCAAGLAAVDTASGSMKVRWRGPSGAGGSPVLGGGAVWVASPASGILYELNPQTGTVRHQISLGGTLPHFASPSLSGGLVLVGTLTGVIAVSGG